MRDQRFIATHRGGPLDKESHAFLARWAADCAEQVLHYFTCCSDDPRPQDALEIGRKWANGEVKTGVAMKASVAAHAAARLVKDHAAIAAARAAAHAVATAHFADHSMVALIYSMKAWEASGISADAAFQLQIAKLPEHLRKPVASGVALRFKRLGSSRMKSDI
jgi:hypothetical protein